MYKLRVGISACLLGAQVRFDGGHKRSAFCTQELARHVEFVPLCPEMGLGLGSPRPAIRLVRQGEGIAAVTSQGGEDLTAPLLAVSQQAMPGMADLSGYILCAKSPSCGMERVRVYGPRGGIKEGVGLFAQTLLTTYPLLPVEEEGRLQDPALRENFILRLFAYHSWQQLMGDGPTPARLIAFHARYKYLLMSHSPDAYARLGRLLGQMQGRPLEAVAAEYIQQLMPALRQLATRAGHSNVLQHLQGYFKRVLSAPQKQELASLIEQYRLGLLPLLAPLTLLRHYLREYPNAYLAQQIYLNPYPDTLKLRTFL